MKISKTSLKLLNFHQSYIIYPVLSHLGLTFVLMLGLFFPEIVMSMDLSSFESHWVLLFCFLSGEKQVASRLNFT